MKYLSICSGIEAATAGWHPLGWEPFAFAEIEPAPCAVLAHHYAHVPNLGDMTQFKDWPNAAIDLLVGGTPCQSFSVAGLRKGLADPRGNLALTFLGIADRYRPEWLIWENVPGVLSLDEGRAFGSIVGGMAELGYRFAYRVLDSQYVRVDGFGRAVPQRRRRVFVVGNSRDWRRAAAVLFEPESLSWNTPPRREKGQRAAPTISARPTGGGGLGTDFDCDGGLIAFGGNNTSGPVEVAAALQAHAGPAGRQDFASETFIAAPTAATLTRGAESSGKGGYAGRRQEDDTNLVAIMDERNITSKTNRMSGKADVSPTMHEFPFTLAIRGRGDSHQLEYRQDGTENAVLTPNGGRGGIGVGAIAFDARQSDVLLYGDKSGPIDTDAFSVAIQSGWAVRRLMPIECERLQGFPDNFTLVPFRGKPMADGPRYKMLGNSMSVNVMRWLGRRIDQVNALSRAA